MPFRFLAVVVTGLALIAPGAHLYELSNKLALSKSDYFVVQGIYRGWWLVGLLLPLAFLANLALAFISRQDAVGRMLALAAAGCILVNLIIFYFYTQPANAVTDNWTLQPENWEALRSQWEYSHAVNAGVTFMAFCLATASAIRK
jgi:Domain of unknown function (DUF1772)